MTPRIVRNWVLMFGGSVVLSAARFYVFGPSDLGAALVGFCWGFLWVAVLVPNFPVLRLWED